MIDYRKPLAIKHSKIPEFSQRVRFEYPTHFGNYVVSWEVFNEKKYAIFDAQGKSLEIAEWCVVNTPSNKQYYVTMYPLGPFATEEAAKKACSKVKGVCTTIEEKYERLDRS